MWILPRFIPSQYIIAYLLFNIILLSHSAPPVPRHVQEFRELRKQVEDEGLMDASIWFFIGVVLKVYYYLLDGE
jgi:hypothetical protein